MFAGEEVEIMNKKGGKTEMTDKPIILIRATQCQPEVEEKFNKWYDEIHIPLLLKFKGITEVTRYKLMTETEEYPKYLAIYTFESQSAFEAYETSPELAAALAYIDQRAKRILLICILHQSVVKNPPNIGRTPPGGVTSDCSFLKQTESPNIIHPK